MLLGVLALFAPALVHSTCFSGVGAGVGNTYDYPALGERYYDQHVGSLTLSRTCGTISYGVFTSYAFSEPAPYGTTGGDEVRLFFGQRRTDDSWLGPIEGEAFFEYRVLDRFARVGDDMLSLRMRFGRPVSFAIPEATVSLVPYLFGKQIMGMNGHNKAYGKGGNVFRIAGNNLVSELDVGFAVYEMYGDFWKTVAPSITHSLVLDNRWGYEVVLYSAYSAGASFSVTRFFR